MDRIEVNMRRKRWSQSGVRIDFSRSCKSLYGTILPSPGSPESCLSMAKFTRWSNVGLGEITEDEVQADSRPTEEVV